MWDSLPWYVQLAIEIGAVVFIVERTIAAVVLVGTLSLRSIIKDAGRRAKAKKAE